MARASLAISSSNDDRRIEGAAIANEADKRDFQTQIERARAIRVTQNISPLPEKVPHPNNSADVTTPPTISHLEGEPLHKSFHITRRAHGISGSSDPAMLDALKRGLHGTSNEGQTDTANGRLAKIIQIGASQTAKIYEQYPGGPAMLEMSYAAQGNIGWKSGRPIEDNIGKTHRKIFTDDRQITTAFREFVFRTLQVGLEHRREYMFPGGNGITGKAEAEQFLDNFQQTKAEQFSPMQLLPDSWVQSRIDEAYGQYRQDKGLQPGASGMEYFLHGSPFAAKIYGSAGFDGLARELKNKLDITIPPKTSWVTDAIFYGMGGYGEAALDTYVSVQATTDNKDLDPITVQTEDLDPGAPGAVIIQGKLGYRFFGALSIGHYPAMSGLAEGTHMGGVGLIIDNHWFPVQTILSYEGHFNQLTSSAKQRVRDVRVNDMSRMLSGQAQYSDLNMTRSAAKFEIRENLNPWATPQEVLIEHHRTQLAYAGPHRRFDAIKNEGASPFNEEWEKHTRQAYEQRVVGKEVSKEEWNDVLHDALTDSWHKYVIESLPFQENKREWQKEFFTPEHKEAYARWDGIAERLTQEQAIAINNMSPPELYKAYADEGLRYPGVYIGIHQGSENEQAYAAGFSRGGPSTNEHAMKNRRGLVKLTYKSEENNYRQVGSLAITHEAYEHADKILKDPLAAAGFVTLMNRSAYPRTDANGQYMEIGPAARLMYHGFTPTKEIDRLLTDTGLKAQGAVDELAKTPGVFKVQQNDNFADIGTRALQGLTGRAVTPQEGAAYGERIRQLNFPQMSEQQAIAEYLFDGALIVLPSPPNTP